MLQTEDDDVQVQVADSSNSVWFWAETDQSADVLRRALLLKRWEVMQFPTSLAYAYVACGRLAAAVQFSGDGPGLEYGSVHSAAGCFVAREAGAIVRDLKDGSPWNLLTSSFVIASSESLYQELSSLSEP